MHYLPDLGLGGTQKTCQLFAEYLNRDEFDVFVAFNRKGVRDRYDLFVEAVGNDRLFAIARPEDEEYAMRTQFPKLCEFNEIDILHVYRSGFPEWPQPGVDIEVPCFVETNVFGFLDNSFKIDKHLFMSQWLMNHAIKQLPSFAAYWNSTMDFVNNPVEGPATDFVHPFKDNIPDDAIILGRCGRPDNGIYNAVNVHAAKFLRMQGYDVRFAVVAAPSNMIRDLEEYEIPYYSIAPTVDPLELSAFYNAIDIYAHARADGETFGVNIAEAMIHGKPVVTHIATPSHPGMGVFQSQTELVDDGVTGFVVRNNPAEYSEALRNLIDNPRIMDRMKVRAIEKANMHYHVDVCVEKLESIYHEIQNNSSS